MESSPMMFNMFVRELLKVGAVMPRISMREEPQLGRLG